MLHVDVKGQGGIIITYGGTIVASKLFKLKLMTKSSTNLEYVKVEESVPYVLWILVLMKDLSPSYTVQVKSCQPTC